MLCKVTHLGELNPPEVTAPPLFSIKYHHIPLPSPKSLHIAHLVNHQPQMMPWGSAVPAPGESVFFYYVEFTLQNLTFQLHIARAFTKTRERHAPFLVNKYLIREKLQHKSTLGLDFSFKPLFILTRILSPPLAPETEQDPTYELYFIADLTHRIAGSLQPCSF